MSDPNRLQAAQDTLLIRMQQIVDTDIIPARVSHVSVCPGQTVSGGEILAHVDGYKLSSEIESPLAGQILQVLVSAGQEIEIDAPMFLLQVSPDANK